MEGVSDEVFVFFSVCLLSIGCGYLGDSLLSRNRARSISQSSNGAIDTSQGPPQASNNPRTGTGFSESEIALQDGQLPICPICLEQVSNAVETSWYFCIRADFVSFHLSSLPSSATFRKSHYMYAGQRPCILRGVLLGDVAANPRRSRPCTTLVPSRPAGDSPRVPRPRPALT